MNKKQIVSLGTCMCIFFNTSVFAKGIKDVWIKLVDYTRVDQAKRTAYFYRVSNYTGLINTVGPEIWEYDYGGL